ncbi:MAG: hypothetical protein OQJ77_05295 [Thiovulaceae bacterium]|nr:hypothetical protein [Sulfurimonadaceae bacterium]MCW9026712.1 hypothetical protein [Sulfurimonadaceae bacterium]
MKFNVHKRMIFLDPHSSIAVANDEKIDLILSPSLYWVQKVKLPVKYIREVKKLLPSLFEDILPDGNYSYSVYKDENADGSYFIFAYEDKRIIDLASSFGINSSNISSVRFAQSVLSTLEGAVKINETQSIYVKEGVVTLVPCCWIEESGDIDLDSIKPSRHTITLAQFGHIVDNSSLYKIAAVLVSFSILFFAEYFITKQKIASLEEEKSALFTKYDLKPTMFQNKALLKKYKDIHKNQTNLRQELSSKLKQNNIKLITYKNNSLKVEL